MAHKRTCFDWIGATFANCSLPLALAIVVLFGVWSDVRAACKIEQIAELKIEQVAGAPMLDGQVNGEHIRMLLDTGSNVSFLTLAAARHMKLLVHRYGDLGVCGPSGCADLEGTKVKELRIGDATLRDHSINVAGQELPDGNGEASLLLGADFLSHFAAEFDLAHGVVRLLRAHECKLDQLAYWTPEFAKADLVRYSSEDSEFILRINVNGKYQMARLASRWSASYITLNAAKDAGIDPTSPGVERIEPVSEELAKLTDATWIAHFDKVEIAGEAIKNARLHMVSVLPDALPRYSRLGRGQVDYEVLLGSDFFLAHRLVIVPDEKAVLFTYNGGKVF